MIQNVYFIEPRTDDSSLIHLLYVVIHGLSLKDLVCCTDNFVRALGGKSHYCPYPLLGISNDRARIIERTVYKICVIRPVRICVRT